MAADPALVKAIEELTTQVARGAYAIEMDVLTNTKQSMDWAGLDCKRCGCMLIVEGEAKCPVCKEPTNTKGETHGRRRDDTE